MSNKDDWRLTDQEKYLRGAILHWKQYKPYRSGWEHDHCEFCWTEFSMDERLDVLQEGYATMDNYRWICKQCFDDFKDMFNWKIAPGSPPVRPE